MANRVTPLKMRLLVLAYLSVLASSGIFVTHKVTGRPLARVAVQTFLIMLLGYFCRLAMLFHHLRKSQKDPVYYKLV